MKILRNLGIVGLLGLASACSKEEPLDIKGTSARAKYLCRIESGHVDSGFDSRITNAVDTNGDGNYDEAFVTKDYVNVHLPTLYDGLIAKATTHYVAPGIAPDKQVLTGFPDTKPMTPEYQRALKQACNNQ